MNEFTRFNSWKILGYPEHLQKVARYETTGDIKDIPYPIVWHVYPSNVCNMNCGFCIMSAEKQQYPKKLSKEILFKLIDDANRIGVKMIHFSGGGEPCLNKSLFEALAYNQSFSNPPSIALSTNGVFFDPKDIEYVNYLRVSLNASCPETHIREMGAKDKWFYDVINKVSFTKEIAKNFKGNHDIGMAFLITETNWTEAYKFTEIADRCKADFVHIRPAYYCWNDPRNIALMDIVQNKMKPLLQMVEKDFGHTITLGMTTEKFEGYWTKRQYDKCRSTPLSAVLTATGEFIVCQDIFIRFGDYYKQTFEEIWFSNEHKEAMNKICIEHCPRCVETRHNQVIQHFYINDDVRKEII